MLKICNLKLILNKNLKYLGFCINGHQNLNKLENYIILKGKYYHVNLKFKNKK